MKKLVLYTAACAAALALFFAGLGDAARSQSQEGRRQLERALRRASLACYAAEGAYPQDLAYLEQRYGVQIDRSRYAVRYEVYGSNLAPDITVLEVAS